MTRIREQEAASKETGSDQKEDGQDCEPRIQLGEQPLLEAPRPYPPNHQGAASQRERGTSGANRDGELTEPQREVFGKVMWNLVASAELVVGIAREQRAQSEGGGTGTFLEPSELKVMRRLLLHGSEVFQGLAELRQHQQCEDQRPTVLFFAEFFRRVRPLQLRDILADIGPRLFAIVVEAKTRLRIQHSQRSGQAGGGGSAGQAHEQDEQGVASLVLRYFAQFPPSPRRAQDADGGRHRSQPPPRALEDEHVGTFLEALFDFVSAHLTKFSVPPSPIPTLASKSYEDEVLASLPRAELQETLVELALFVGRQALLRPTDIRMKHVFFSVFVFCVKQAREG